MALPVKILLGGAVVAGVGGTAVFILYQEPAPECSTLDKDFLFSMEKSVYKGKHSEPYARFLAGPGSAQKGSETTNNNPWWEWSFKNRYSKDEAQGGFRNVSRAVRGVQPDNSSLQEVCDSAYKAESTNVTSQDPAAANKYREDQIWQYCGVIKKKPVLLKDIGDNSPEDSRNLADHGAWKGKSGEVHKADLLAIHHRDNTEAWELLNFILESERNKGNVSGFFADDTKGPTARGKCDSAYRLDTSSASDGVTPSETDLYKWCSLKGSKDSTP